MEALRKNVTAKCGSLSHVLIMRIKMIGQILPLQYGGDIIRKMKLFKKQKEGKKRLKRTSSIELDKEAFLSVIER